MMLNNSTKVEPFPHELIPLFDHCHFPLATNRITPNSTISICSLATHVITALFDSNHLYLNPERNHGLISAPLLPVALPIISIKHPQDPIRMPIKVSHFLDRDPLFCFPIMNSLRIENPQVLLLRVKP
ncbi:hypothetical protein HGB07_07680, partial [Candidatus Roizmanbacteria bacterium]|nr:hypothetical protein [Candidatus Roizmanbacteria bacterium]